MITLMISLMVSHIIKTLDYKPKTINAKVTYLPLTSTPCSYPVQIASSWLPSRPVVLEIYNRKRQECVYGKGEYNR